MNKPGQRVITALILAVFMISVSGVAGVLGTSSTGPKASASPKAADYPVLADQNTIVDPRGQTVKQSQQLELSRSGSVNLVNPIDFALNVQGYKIIGANIPLSLALTYGMTFPLQASVGYDPYAVLNGTSFPYLITLDNNNCTPYATVGVNMNFNMSDLSFTLANQQIPLLSDLGVNFADISYQNSWNIPFFGVNTPIGNLVSYPIVDKYYSLDSLLNLVGLPSISSYGVSGGVGVSVVYNLQTSVSALATVSSRLGGNVSSTVNWNSLGNQVVQVAVNKNSQYGEVMTVTIGNWVYTISQSVTLTVWANLGLTVVGINLINQQFSYAYTLGLGSITFPEKTNFKFVSHPQVLAGKLDTNVPASWSALGINYNGLTGGNFNAVNYNVPIPADSDLQQWFSNMNINAGFGASLNVNFPYNIQSFYNARNAIPNSNLDYNTLVDSVGASSPNIGYTIGGFMDLSKVSVLGYKLGNYSFSTSNTLFSAANLFTPLGDATWNYEITNLVDLNTLSTELNNYIMSVDYGINPDIQFRAWLVLNMHGEMTGTMNLVNNNAGASVIGATAFDWNSQYDTQTTRINIPSSATPGQGFDVQYSNLQYSLSVTPGICLGVSVLGGIAAFNFTIMIPGVSGYLSQNFAAPSFTDHVTVQSVGVSTSNLNIPTPTIPAGIFTTSGTFSLTNTGSTTDNYVIQLDTAQLPAGTTGQYSINGGAMQNFGTATTNNCVGGIPNTVSFTLNLGPAAHDVDYLMNTVWFTVTSTSHPYISTSINTQITLVPDSNLISTQVNVEANVPIMPGFVSEVPVSLTNNGVLPVTYTLALLTSDPKIGSLSTTSMSLQPGQSGNTQFAINVPAATTSAPGTYPITLQIGSPVGYTTQTFNYVVQNFSNPEMNIYQGLAPTTQIMLGSNATYEFVLTNNGNIAQSYTVAAAVDSGTVLVNNVGPSQTIPLSVGQQTYVGVTLTSLKPGMHTFNVTLLNGAQVVFCQTYNVKVIETQVNVMTSNYNYTSSPLTYTITLYNAGNIADTFDVSIVGLDSSAYTLSEANNIFIPAGSAVPITMTIKPTDLTKVAGGVNPFFVGVESQTYKVVETNTYSAVALPIYQHTAIGSAIAQVDNGSVFDVSFVFVYSGNIHDNFTVSVQNCNLPYVVITNSTVETTATGNAIFVSGGVQAVLVTVEFAKTTEGLYNPTIVITNSAGVVVQTFSTAFGVGFVYVNLMWIVLIGAIVLVGVVLAFVVYRRREMSAYLTESERAARQSQVFGRLGAKLQEIKKEVSTKRATKEMEKLDKPTDSGWTDAETVSLKLTAKPERLSKVRETLSEKRKEKDDIKQKSKDESFWK